MKTIRVWNGCRVVGLLSVDGEGISSFLGATGGAASSGKVDVDLDPWAGLIVDHSIDGAPVAYREAALGD